MNRYPDLEAALRSTFTDRADVASSDAQVGAILDRVAATRQRPSWLAALRSRTMITSLTAPRASVPRSLIILVVLALVAAVALVALGVIGRPASSPLNGKIVFAEYQEAVGDTVLFTVDPDGTHLMQLDAAGHEGGVWSPDGRQIVATDAIFDVDAGTHAATSFHDGQILLPPWDWSPDGSLFLVEGFLADGAPADPNVHGVYVMSAPGGGSPRMLSKPGEDGGPGRFSPDGRMVAYVRSHPGADAGSEGGELVVINLDGSGARRLGDLISVSPHLDWAPDGGSILVTDTGRLYSVDVATGTPTQLTIQGAPDALIRGATWSPDGTRILFARGNGQGDQDLYSMAADGTHVVPIAIGPNQIWFFDWGVHPLG